MADATGRVVGLEQHDADAGGGCSVEHDAVELVVGAVTRVVEIMELAHGGDAGVAHLLERLGAGLEAAAGPGQVAFDDLRAHARPTAQARWTTRVNSSPARTNSATGI